MQNTGDPRVRGGIVAVIEHVLSDRPGEWWVSIVGSHANDNWEMAVEGPEGFERSYSLVGSAGEHQPVAIGNLLVKCCRRASHDLPFRFASSPNPC